MENQETKNEACIGGSAFNAGLERRVRRITEKTMIELNDQTRQILGRPNFTCIRIAARLRELGHKIENRAEDEQAVTIHWLLGMYETHGENWAEAAEAYLKQTPNIPIKGSASALPS